LGRRIVTESIQGSFNIWLKKSIWTSFVINHSLNINNALEEFEDDDLITEGRKQDYKIELSQIALVQECKMPEINLLVNKKFGLDF
jgi:hypothetical protein